MKTKIIKVLTFCIMLTIAVNCQSSKNPFQEIIREQFQRYPQMQIRDLYKLVYQAAMGNIHLGVDPAILKNYLISEMDKVDRRSRREASDNEPMVEEISAEGMIRVNLRPYKEKGGDSEKLFEAMMETANNFKPDKNKILQYWEIIEKMAKENSIPFKKNDLESFLKEMQASDYPAVHHSDQYSESYHPAYRVILKKYLPTLE